MGLYFLLAGAATRWRRINQAAVEPFWRGRGGLILCIWHGRFTMGHKLWFFGPGAAKLKMLISRSREGEIAAHAARTVGAEVIRGSPAKRGARKGGVEAMREMMRWLSEGGVICMTPDGPRGPRMRAALGPVQLAKLSGAPLLCMAWSAKQRIVLKSWDRFMLPLPLFGPGVLIWSDPIPAPSADASAAEMEAARALLESELNRITAQADRLAGAEVIAPEPLAAMESAT